MLAQNRYLATLAAVACCIILGQVTSAKSPPSTYVNIIDYNDISFVAKVVCEVSEGYDYQISKISTVMKLSEFFNKLPVDHELNDCHSNLLVKLTNLKDVIEHGKDLDLCGPKSIDELMKFHKKYIARTSSDGSLSVDNVLPQVLELFFINYMYEVSLVCKDNLIKKLDSPKAIELNMKLVQESGESLDELDRLNEKFSVLVGGKSGSLSRFYDIILLWSQLDRSPLGSDVGAFSEPSYTNDYKRVTVVSKEAEKVIRVQQECKALKPLYESPLLAVVQLIDLGYYIDNEPFERHLANRPNLRRLIGLAIICETLAPVAMIQDDTLKEDENKMLSNKEAKDYPTSSEVEVAQPEFNFKLKPRHYKLSTQILSYVTPGTAHHVVTKLIHNVRDREKFVKRVLRSYMGRWKLKIKSFFAKLFFLSSAQGKRDLFPADVLPLFEMLQ